MFAFVHYDRVREQLTIGRDPFGIKPLYVRTHADGEISIGSTVSSLAALGGTLQPDGDSLAGFLGWGLLPAGASAFADIVKVAPGTVVTLKRGQGGWQGSSDHIEGRHWTRTSVREAVEDSVAAHLVADVEVGVLLSGGIDSTLLAVHASRMQPGIRTFRLTNPDNPEIDEAGYARHGN